MLPLEADYEFIYQSALPAFRTMSGSNLFLTGGTGFFGKWILGAIHYANITHGASISVTSLTRNPDSFIHQFPHFKNSLFHFLKGDIRDFQTDNFRFQYLIHGANPSQSNFKPNLEAELLSTIKEGTKHFLDFAQKTEAKKLLLLSSGAVYGKQDSLVVHQPELQQSFAETESSNAYTAGKRNSELSVLQLADHSKTSVSIARCYAFVGPHLPLDQHFAIGNFINDCIHHRPITIQGDGTACRSYLYAADLTVWLLRLLVFGDNKKAYNVGSELSFSIKEIAEQVQEVWQEPEFKSYRKFNSPSIVILEKVDSQRPTNRYVPSTMLAKSELNLEAWTPLKSGIRKTIQFYLKRNEENDHTQK